MEIKTAGVHIVFYRMLPTQCYKNGEQYRVQAVLLYKRTQDAPNRTGYWALFGGTKKASEDDKTTLIRELVEEHELQVKCMSDQNYEGLLQDAEKLTCVPDDCKMMMKYYKAKLEKDMDSLFLGQNPNENNKVEGEGLGWFTEEESRHLCMRREDSIALRRFFHPEKD